MIVKPRYVIALWAIFVIAALEAYALSKGIDGVMFGTATAGVGAIAGYAFKDRKT